MADESTVQPPRNSAGVDQAAARIPALDPNIWGILPCAADRFAARDGQRLQPLQNVSPDVRKFLDILMLALLGVKARNNLFELWILRDGMIGRRQRKCLYNNLHQNVHNIPGGWRLDLVTGYVEVFFDRHILRHPHHMVTMTESTADFVAKMVNCFFCSACLSSPDFAEKINQFWSLLVAISPACKELNLQ